MNIDQIILDLRAEQQHIDEAIRKLELMALDHRGLLRSPKGARAPQSTLSSPRAVKSQRAAKRSRPLARRRSSL